MAKERVMEVVDRIERSHRDTVDLILSLKDDLLNLETPEGKGITVRRRLIHAVDHVRMHADQVLKTRRKVRGHSFPEALPNEVEHFLMALEEAYGAFKGILLTLDDDDLDKDPGEGRWPIRRIIEHVIDAERSYVDTLTKTVQSTGAR
ncbi:MAG: DinB family protein [bacterium]